jgi:hypothetical protein
MLAEENIMLLKNILQKLITTVTRGVATAQASQAMA